MADHTIDIPGIGAVAFPDSMSPDEVSAAAHRLYTEAQYTANQTAAEVPSRPEGYWEGVGRRVLHGPNLTETGGHPLITGNPPLAAVGPLPIPAGRLTSAGWGAVKGTGRHLPGSAAVRGAIRGGLQAWKASDPATAAIEAGPRVAAAAETLIKSPAEIAAAEQLAKLAQMEARRRGLLSAAGQAAKAWPK